MMKTKMRTKDMAICDMIPINGGLLTATLKIKREYLGQGTEETVVISVTNETV